jgi:hypothetical protein
MLELELLAIADHTIPPRTRRKLVVMGSSLKGDAPRLKPCCAHQLFSVKWLHPWNVRCAWATELAIALLCPRIEFST